MLVIFTPREGAKQFVKENFGEVTYEELGENESLGGLIATRNQVLTIRALGQTYEFGEYGRPVFNPEKAKISIIGKSKPLPKEEQLAKRRTNIEASRVAGPIIKNFSGILGEWGANPKAEPTTKQIRKIYEICKCQVPIWICDTAEAVLKWGGRERGLDPWLRQNYSQYVGLPTYRIPPIDFSTIDLTNFPTAEKEFIESGKLNCCENFAEQGILLLQDACKRLNFNPVIIDQNKLRKSGAFRKGIDRILENKEELEEKFGSLFRVECPNCGKYIFNVEIQGDKVYGICDGRVKAQNQGENESELEEAVKFEGCGSRLEESVSYLYERALPGKMLTSMLMANSDVGVFFPDKEFVSTRIYTGPFSKMMETTARYFNSGIPEAIRTGALTYNRETDNIYSVLDFIPAKDLEERLNVCTIPGRNINIGEKSIEPLLVNKLKSFSPPADPRLIADVLYSLRARKVDMTRLGWNLDGTEPYVTELLRCLGNVRKNRVLETRPQDNWAENYQEFMNEKFIPEEEVEKLRNYMTDKNSKVRTIMETAYLGSLSN